MKIRLPQESQGFIEEPMHNPVLDLSHHSLPQQDVAKSKQHDSERYIDTLGNYDEPISDSNKKDTQENDSLKATSLCALSWKGIDTITVSQTSKLQVEAIDQVAKPGKLEMFKRFVANIANPAPVESSEIKAKKTDDAIKLKATTETLKPAVKKVNPEASPRVEIAKPTEETEEQTSLYFSTVVDKFISAFDWLWGSKSSESDAIQPKKFTDEEKKQLQSMLKMMSELLHQIKEITENGEENIKFDELMKYMRLAKEEEGIMAKERMLQYFKQRQELHKERFKKMEETLELAKKGKYGTRFAEFASAAQILATAAGLSSGLMYIGLLFAAGNAIDSMFDDPVKKLLVSPFAQGDLDTEQKGVFYIKMAMGVLALGVMLNNTGVFTKAGVFTNVRNPYGGLKRASAVLKGSSMATSSYLENRTSTHDAVMKELKHNIDEKDGKVKSTMKDMDRLINMIHEMYRRQWQEQSNKTEITTGIFR